MAFNALRHADFCMAVSSILFGCGDTSTGNRHRQGSGMRNAGREHDLHVSRRTDEPVDPDGESSHDPSDECPQQEMGEQ